MSEEKKPSLVREFSVYFIPTLLQIVVSPLSLYFYSRVLTREDYGVWGLISVTTGLLLIFSNWGLVNGMVRYLGEPNEDENRLIGTAYYGSLLSGLMIFLLFYSMSSLISLQILGSSGFRNILVLGTFSAIYGMASQASQNLLRMKRKATLYVLFETANLLLTCGLGIVFVYVLRFGLSGVFLSILAVQTCVSVLQWFYLHLRYAPRASWSCFRKLFAYGAPFTIIIIGTWVLDWSDRYILKFFVPLSDIGLYHVAYSYGMFTQALVTPFIVAVLPYLFDYHRNNEYAQKTGTLAFYYIVFYMGVVLVISMLAKPYFLILTPPQFHPAVHIASWISLGYAWRGLFNILCFCNTLTGNAKAQFVIELSAAALNIVLNLLLIPRFGLYGAVAATLTAWVLALAFLHNQRTMPIALPGKRAVQAFAVGLLCFGAIVVLNRYPFWPLGVVPVLVYFIFVHFKVQSLTPAFAHVRQRIFG
jgi:O-antigen/teichoic acid export membrane protein